MDRLFSRLASLTADGAGHPAVFMLALAAVVVWAMSGPAFGFSETWQLVINTGTTVITFLMVFLIQNSQSRDTRALQIKLDELIRVTEGADDSLIDLERLSPPEIARLHRRYCAIAERIKALGLDTAGPSSVAEPAIFDHGDPDFAGRN